MRGGINPRSYEVETAEGTTYRRKRRDVVLLPEEQPAADAERPVETDTEPRDTAETSDAPSRRSGRPTQPPQRYDPSWNGLRGEMWCHTMCSVMQIHLLIDYFGT